MANHIGIVYDVTRDGVYHTAQVPVTYLRGTWPMKELIAPTELAALARYANTLQKG